LRAERALKVKSMNAEIVWRAICCGCGSTGLGPTEIAAWRAVRHDGHFHRAEELDIAAAKACGAAETEEASPAARSE
jgi:hypothetical protein